MRTANPQNIKADFLSGLKDIEDALADVTGKGILPKTKLHVAEYSFLAASVLLESFISDLFVAYINKKNGPFVAYLVGRMTIEATEEHAKRAIPLASVDIGSHLTLDKIRQVLDPNSWNLTFATAGDLKAKANQWLAAPYKANFNGISNAHGALLETTKSVRNYLAHRSGASLSTMQAALTNARLPVGFRRGANKVHSVGSFLDSTPPGGGQTRLATYLLELNAIAAQLCP
jgi:hypothetical protein